MKLSLSASVRLSCNAESVAMVLARKLEESEMTEQDLPAMVVAQKLEDSEIKDSPLLVVAPKLEDSEIMEQDSLHLTSKVPWIDIFNISYRGLCKFQNKNVPAIEMKIKKLMPVDAELRILIDRIENGGYDAPLKKYLKTLLLCVGETVEGPMIEEYASWMRIGAFLFDSPVAFLTEKQALTRTIPRGVTVEKMLESRGFYVLNNIKAGIWIAGTLQTLDSMLIKLFFKEGYKNECWVYPLIRTDEIERHVDGATGCIFEVSGTRKTASEYTAGHRERDGDGSAGGASDRMITSDIIEFVIGAMTWELEYLLAVPEILENRSEEDVGGQFLLAVYEDVGPLDMIDSEVVIANQQDSGEDEEVEARCSLRDFINGVEYRQENSARVVGVSLNGWSMYVDAMKGYVMKHIVSHETVLLPPYDPGYIRGEVYGTWTGTPGTPDFRLFVVDKIALNNSQINARLYTQVGGWMNVALQFRVAADGENGLYEFGENGLYEFEDEFFRSVYALTIHEGRLHLLVGCHHAVFDDEQQLVQSDYLVDNYGSDWLFWRHRSFLTYGDSIFLLFLNGCDCHVTFDLTLDGIVRRLDRFPQEGLSVYSNNVHGGAMVEDEFQPRTIYAAGGHYGPTRNICLRIHPRLGPIQLHACLFNHPHGDRCRCTSYIIIHPY